MKKYTIEYYTSDQAIDGVVVPKTVTIDAETEQSAVSKFEQMYDDSFYISVREENE